MKKVLVINNEFLGQGSEELGKRLMGSFLRRVWANQDKPEAIIFYNSGVKLCAKGSEALDAIYGLFEAGVDLLACGTCVTFYELQNKLEAARVSNMEEIATLLLTSDSVITV